MRHASVANRASAELRIRAGRHPRRGYTRRRLAGARNSIYWWETEPVTPGPPLQGTERADVCIVGGGYTGLWTAYFLKQGNPSLEVVVVERNWAGSGASGHNDGYAMTVLDMSLHHLVEHGHRVAVVVARGAGPRPV